MPLIRAEPPIPEPEGTSPSDRRPSRRRRIVFIAVVWVAILLAAEGLARAVLLPGTPLITTTLDKIPNLKAGDFFRRHPTLFWELRPNIDRPFSPWGDRTNSLGFRGPREPDPDAAFTRVLCLGDSCTYGLGLPWHLTWPAVLDRVDGIEALNAGVPGYTSHQGRALFEDRCRALAPDVLVLQFGTNDSNLWPVSRDGIFHFLADRQVSEHLELTAVSRYSALLGAILAAVRKPGSTAAPGFSDLDHGTAPPRVSSVDLAENLAALAAEVDHAVILIWPLRRHFDPSRFDPVPVERSEACRRAMLALAGARVTVIDLHDEFARSGLRVEAIYLDDVHVTARGARLVADLVSRAILARR